MDHTEAIEETSLKKEESPTRTNVVDKQETVDRRKDRQQERDRSAASIDPRRRNKKPSSGKISRKQNSKASPLTGYPKTIDSRQASTKEEEEEERSIGRNAIDQRTTERKDKTKK